MKNIAIVLLGCIVGVFIYGQLLAYNNSTVRGYKKPRICLKGNNRCILKQLDTSVYWCLKTEHQKVLDTRRNTSPIKKTRRENMGHCSKILPVNEDY